LGLLEEPRYPVHWLLPNFQPIVQSTTYWFYSSLA